MCHLKIKVRIIGKKNQEFIRFIILPKNIRQRGKYRETLGYWDTRLNANMRYVVLNIYKILRYYSYGAQANKTTLRKIFYYFIDFTQSKRWLYFDTLNMMLFIENEIKEKYL